MKTAAKIHPQFFPPLDYSVYYRYFCKQNKHMNALYPDFFTHSMPFASGNTDFTELKGRKVEPAPGAIFFCLSGKTDLLINQQAYLFSKGDIMILFPDTVPYITGISDDFKCRFVLMSRNFTDEATARLSTGFFDMIFFNPIISHDETDNVYREIFMTASDILTEMTNIQHRYIVMRNLMESFFLVLNSRILKSRIKNDYSKSGRAQYIFREFWKLMINSCPGERSVSFYADKLCITPYYLNKCVKEIAKTTAKEFIDRQMIIYIKELLHSTTLSINEIAVRLQYEDPSYMCRFFRKRTGMTLTDFRNFY